MAKRVTKKPSWNAELHKKVIGAIEGLNETDSEEFRAIFDASHRLLKKYNDPPHLSEDVKTILNGFSSSWNFDYSTESVNIDGTLASADLGLESRSRWYREESKKDKKLRLAIFKTMKDVKFGNCRYFSIRHSGLKQLWPALPRKVSYHFDCSHNELTSLKNGPDWVSEYDCSNNKLTSLKYISKYIDGDLKCSYNEITSLEPLKNLSLATLNCADNKLRDLVGCPEIRRRLVVSHNKLVSMKGAPINLTLRDIDLEGNVVSSKSLKLAFNAMKAADGDYSKGLLKIWKKIPLEDQIHMYNDLPTVTEDDVRKYEAFRNFMSIKDVI